MSEHASQKIARHSAEKLGRSQATGQYVLKPAHRQTPARAEKMREIVEKVIASHAR
jgi:hypothetical protein